MNIICCANQDQPRTSAAECPILPDGIKTKFPGCGSWAQAFWKWETKGSEFIWVLCVSSSISQSIILTTGPKARNGKTKLASCRAELPRAESPFLAAGPCTSSTRLSPQPETNFMSERCKCIANALQIRFGVLCDCPEFKSLVGSIESPKLFFWNFHSVIGFRMVPHGSASNGFRFEAVATCWAWSFAAPGSVSFLPGSHSWWRWLNREPVLNYFTWTQGVGAKTAQFI